MNSTLYGLAVEMVAVMSLWLGLSVWQRDRCTAGSLLFTGLIGSVMVWCLGLALAEHGVVDTAVRGRIIWAGVLTLPPLWLGVAAHASGLPLARRIPWFPAALMLPSVLLYGLLFAGPWEHLFLVHDGSVGEEGPLFPLWIAWSYALTLAGAALFVRAAFRWPREGLRRRAIALAVAVLIPLVGNFLYVFADTGLAEDPTPVLVGLAILPLRAAIFHGGLFDVLPVDQRDLLLRLPVGIVLSERERGVIEINRRAGEILGVSRAQAMGRGVEALLSDAPDDVAFHLEDVDLGVGHALACLIVTRRSGGVARSSLHAA
jgi:PAS domain-containing protein